MSEDKRRNLRDVLDELDRYFEEFEKEVQDAVRDGIHGAKFLSKPFVAGFSMNMGPEGRPLVRFFGDDPQKRDGFRTPVTEQAVDHKLGKLRLLVDVPGVEKKDIDVSATEETAVVKAEGSERRYRTEVRLESQVDPSSGKAEYRNGVLEISFSLRDKTNKDFRRVSVV